MVPNFYNSNTSKSKFISKGSIFLTSILMVVGLFASSFRADNSMELPAVLASRTISNTNYCTNTLVDYSFYLGTNLTGNFPDRFYQISNSQFTEFDDGTATLTGVAINNSAPSIKYDLNISFAGRTYFAPYGSPKAPECVPLNDSDWYYYNTTSGTLTGLDAVAGAIYSISRRGPAMQLGTGANVTDSESVFSGSGWFEINELSGANNPVYDIDTEVGDFNLRLSGSSLNPNGCQITTPADVTINCNESTASSNTGELITDCGITVPYTDVLSGTCPQIITRTWSVDVPSICNDVLVEYKGNCNDPDDSLYPTLLSNCISTATDIAPINGPSNASCANDIICINSLHNSWDFTVTAQDAYSFNNIVADFLYPIYEPTAGGSANATNCNTNLKREVFQVI